VIKLNLLVSLSATIFGRNKLETHYMARWFLNKNYYTRNGDNFNRHKLLAMLSYIEGILLAIPE